MDSLMDLTNNPQVKQIMQNFGISPEMAQQFLKNMTGNANQAQQQQPPNLMQMFMQQMMNNNQNQGNTSNPNIMQTFMQQMMNPNQSNTQQQQQQQPSTTTTICDNCDLPILSDELKYTCLSCEDFDLHQSCYNGRKHDAEHDFITQYATEEKICNLIAVGSADRDLCIDFLNVEKGDFEKALQKLNDLTK